MASITPPRPIGGFAGPWYTWWAGDTLPPLPAWPGLVAAPAEDDAALAALAALDLAEVARRRREGNRPYLASVAGEPVACGWSTARRVEIGEIDLAFSLPPGGRYLWGFVTAEPWRGRGLYPRLLQAILRAETIPDARFWIGHTPDNHASARGILKAGFRRVGDVHFLQGGGFALFPAGPSARAAAGAALLGAELRERA